MKDELPGGLALSKDGSTALAGQWILTRRGNRLVRRQKLSAAKRSPSRLGYSKSDTGTPAALSANGKVALLGYWNHDNGKGAAWGFRKSGGTWVGSPLTPTGRAGRHIRDDLRRPLHVCRAGFSRQFRQPDDRKARSGARAR